MSFSRLFLSAAALAAALACNSTPEVPADSGRRSLDEDGDGLADGVGTIVSDSYDIDGDSKDDGSRVDTDGDGKADAIAYDTDGDGV